MQRTWEMDDDYAEASSEMVSVKEWLEKKILRKGNRENRLRNTILLKNGTKDQQEQDFWSD